MTARQVANQIALRKAVEQVGTGKIITFHASVKSAASFTGPDSKGLRTHLPEFQAYHVNGTMRAAERDRIMQEFRAATKAVISNARCLTEGVDVPAVDMVAFIAPRRSRVDIVQATGRAMRTAGGKTTGYVFLPLFVQEAVGESVEEAVARGDFREIWTVLQALQEQDEVLADAIREMRQAKGRTGSFDDSRFREKVQAVGRWVSLEVIQRAIATRCIERLATSWDYMFGRLAAFKDRFGHCNVSAGWSEDSKLGWWVRTQRHLGRYGNLPQDRFQQLHALGFEWDRQPAREEATFAQHLARLIAFKDRFGHCNVPANWPENRPLAAWVSNQRRRRSEGRASPEVIERLDAIGFDWDMDTAVWEEMLARLVQFKGRLGHCNVPVNWPEDRQLGGWVARQRVLRDSGDVSALRIQRLDAIGFEWDMDTAVWEEMLARLVQFKGRLGHCNVPVNWPEDRQLGGWVFAHRQLKAEGRVSAERILRLDALGFKWDWEAATEEGTATMVFLSRLFEFKKRFGHCNVPTNWPEDPELARWVARQRVLRHRKYVPASRIEQLDGLGFEWDTDTAVWEEMLARLVQFKKRFGHCNVPTNWPEDRQLARWVTRQGRLKQDGNLSADRIQQLDALGFESGVNEGQAG